MISKLVPIEAETAPSRLERKAGGGSEAKMRISASKKRFWLIERMRSNFDIINELSNHCCPKKKHFVPKGL